MTTSAPVAKPSALATIRALSKKAPAPAVTALSTQITDPAIAGARREGKSSAVKLGFDPSIAAKAKKSAELKAEVDRATAEFVVLQAEMRDYGKSKRDLYNDTFRCTVTTVCVPYSVESATGDEATPGRETKYVQVICTSKYSVNQETVSNVEKDLGDDFQKLFVKEETKVLKPNAEELIRQLLAEAGLGGEELDSAMGTLFETETKISASEHYEQEVRNVPDPMRAILDLAVTRQQPGLKFSV